LNDVAGDGTDALFEVIVLTASGLQVGRIALQVDTYLGMLQELCLVNDSAVPIDARLGMNIANKNLPPRDVNVEAELIVRDELGDQWVLQNSMDDELSAQSPEMKDIPGALSGISEGMLSMSSRSKSNKSMSQKSDKSFIGLAPKKRHRRKHVRDIQ
jgi:hypothetical protein